MKWNEALAQIESPEFDANLSMFSSTKAFFRAMAADPVVLDLLVQIHESGELREEVLDRIYDLAGLEIDSRYENPNDKPLTVLLWIIRDADPDIVKVAAHYTVRAPQCWYAWKLARSIMAPPPPVESGNYRFEFDAKCLRFGNSPATASTFNIMPVDSKLRLISLSVAKSAHSETNGYTLRAAS